ncbi:hypothetical protein [Lacibacter sp.]|uniref:hypothetical protein n=1 Tax=Lacibacter sp. TaxID=1915409 RepID=UPI002B4B2BC4|nr:hypothetical protein [Lacibacter sp.]HLP37943.1 hypothetical protein [Lacibacter sp.]
MITVTKKLSFNSNLMISRLIIILEKVRDKVSDESDVVWAGYDTAKELREEIQLYINELSVGNLQSLKAIDRHFAPTSTLQEHSISNGWSDEYLRLAEKFDAIYSSLKNHS